MLDTETGLAAAAAPIPDGSQSPTLAGDLADKDCLGATPLSHPTSPPQWTTAAPSPALSGLQVDPRLAASCSLTRNIATWERELRDDPDRDFILQGIAQGFDIVEDLSSVPTADCSNYASATDKKWKPKLDALFQRELNEGYISQVDYKPLRINSIGAVEKQDMGDPRPITDMSRPLGDSVNEQITCDSFKFKSVDDAINLMQPNCFFAVVDLKSAYRHVPIKRDQATLQGFRWMFGDQDNSKYMYFVDNRLCFGLKNAASIFHRISSAVTRMMAKRGFHCVVQFLDDFLLIGYSEEAARMAQLALIRLLTSLGFSVSWSKVVSPTTRVVFLGVILDSQLMQAEATPEKMQRLRDTITALLQRNKASKRELQSLAGLMNFVAKVIKGARTFLRRIIDTINSLRHPHHLVRLNRSMKLDLHWWLCFMQVFNGKALLIGHQHSPQAHVYTDASFSGYGAYMDSERWLAGVWTPKDEREVHPCVSSCANWLGVPSDFPAALITNINYLELFAILQSVRHFAPLWANHRVFIHTDNTQAMYFINKKAPALTRWPWSGCVKSSGYQPPTTFM